jgi:hypothetical protein
MKRYIDTTALAAKKAAREAQPGEPTPTPSTYANYCDEGLLDHIRLENGTRLLREGEYRRGVRLYRDRLAKRGGDRRPKLPAPEAA